MDERTRKVLAAKLAGLDRNEQNKLYKRAALLRRSTYKGGRSHRAAIDEEDDQPVYQRKTGSSLDDLVLRLLEQEEPPAAPADTYDTGAVVWVGQGMCRVVVRGSELTCELVGNLAKRQQSSIAVGDEAWVECAEEHPIVRSVAQRRTHLSRPDPANPNRQRLIAANIDLALVVVSIKSPPLHPRLIDRYLVAIEAGGIQAALCVNKLDLASDDFDLQVELKKLDPYGRAGVPIVPCSAALAEGGCELRKLIEGKTCAFVGHSGVGKSSILNMLRPELALDTGAVSEGYGRGRHTTTASNLFDLGDGTRLIDTPGIRSFGLWQMSAEELAGYFPEFGRFVGCCRFRDCTHRQEPGCEVREAATREEVSGYRYETYRRLLEEL